MGIKKNSKIAKPCTNCFSPEYIKFNFSYISYEKDFEDRFKLQLFKRFRELSEVPYVVILNRDKRTAFEFEEIKIRKEVPLKFQQRFQSKDYNNKFAIMRLYPNNNPAVVRIIGVIIKNIFYIFFIDVGGKFYKH